MRYTIYHWFTFGGSSFGGFDDICANTPRGAVEKVRRLHPNKNLRIVQVRLADGPYAGRRLKEREWATHGKEKQGK